MTIFVEIADPYTSLIGPALIERSAIMTLELQGSIPESDLTIFVTDDSRIHQLNQEYRQIDAPTDVLAFPAGYTDPDTAHRYLGDIIVSFDQARNQAQRSENTVEDELQLLVVHGVLHLLGFDHDKADDKEKMWLVQNQILNHLGVNVSLPE